MFCQILGCKNVNGWNYTQKDVFHSFSLYHLVYPGVGGGGSFADSRALEMFVALFPCTVNLIICASSSKLICRCRNWNLWQEVEHSSGFNTVHNWIEINPEQLHLNVIVASELFTAIIPFLSNVSSPLFLLLVIYQGSCNLGWLQRESRIKRWIFMILIWRLYSYKPVCCGGRLFVGGFICWFRLPFFFF